MATCSEFLHVLRKQESNANGNTKNLQTIEQELEDHSSHFGHNPAYLRFRNLFRVSHANHMRVKRPRVLLGAINYSQFPDHQTIALLRCADVVSLCANSDEKSADRLYFDVTSMSLDKALSDLPAGFRPDLYWEPCICTSGFVPPRGLHALPFITVASIRHHERALELNNIAHNYDVLCPHSAKFGDILHAAFPGKAIFNLHFDLDWPSVDLVNLPHKSTQDRDIDVLLTYGEGKSLLDGDFRAKLHQLFDTFVAKHGETYRCCYIPNPDRATYIEHLGRSKIALNVAGLVGPFNRQTAEIINSGAVLMQYEAIYPVGDQAIETCFEPETEVILFNEANFEEKLLDLLADPEKTATVALSGQKRLKADYGHENLYHRLFSECAHEISARGGKLNRLAADIATATRTLAMFHSNDPAKRNSILLDINATAEAMELPVASILLPMLRSLSKEHSVEILQVIFDRNPAFTSYLADPIDGYRLIYGQISGPSLTDHWNLTVLGYEAGVKDTPLLLQLFQKLLHADASDFSILSFFATDFRIPGIDTEFCENALMSLLNLGVLLAEGDTDRIGRAIQGYMLFWVCTLLDHMGDTSADWRARADAFLG